MRKDKYFFGQPIFSQIINLLDKKQLDRIAKEHNSDHYCKKFSTFQHLITMGYGVISGCNSLREVCSGIVSYGNKIQHCKFSSAPKRSTFSDANRKRSHEVFEAIYYALVKQYTPILSDSQNGKIDQRKIFAIDSTTFSLFQPIFECTGRKANNGKSKGGIKSHQKLDLEMGIPVKIYHSSARKHDTVFIENEDVLNENEIGIFDRAYNKYSKFAQWNAQNKFFVTRLKKTAKEEIIEEYDLADDCSDKVLKDAKIRLKYKQDGQEKDLDLRLVSYFDDKTNKAFYFLTNLHDLSPDTIADLYKKRWQIELLFKKIKQNFPMQYFYGDHQNAIQTQIWCTLIMLLLITVMQKRLTKKYAFSNLISLIQKHLFTYIRFEDFFNDLDKIINSLDFSQNKDPAKLLKIEGLTF